MNLWIKLKNLWLVCFVILLLLAPDYIYQCVDDKYKVLSVLKALKFIIPLSVGLVFNKYIWITYSAIALLCLLQLMQFSVMSFFGRYLMAYDFTALFDEFNDIFLSATSALANHWKVIPIVLIPFGLLSWILRLNNKRSVYGTATLIITAFSIFVVNLQRGVPYPLDGRITIDNTLKSFSFALRDVVSKYNPPKYAEYEIKNVGIKTDEPITIVYVVGESVNYKHMSLFGYERNTTPMLKELAKSENFYYVQGISGAVCTKAANKFMMNVIWEPNNIKLNADAETSLCRFAKENGFKVFYLTSQDNKMLASICTAKSKYINVTETRNTNEAQVLKKRDDYIFDLLDKQKFTDRNFIIIQQRCPHDPYTEHYPDGYNGHRPFGGSKDVRIDDYDNIMLYEDTFLYRVFERFNKQTTGKFYIIFASDHNELFDEEGLWGHSTLHPLTANIPVLVQSNDVKFMKKIRSIFRPTHHEIAQLLANVMGFEVTNPNQKANMFFINGIDFDGRRGYMEVYKDLKNKSLSYKTYR